MLGLSLFVAALVPLIIGAIWYNPKVLGALWMRESGLSEEQLRGGSNLIRIYGLTYLFSVLLAFLLQFMVVHQYSAASLVATPPFDTAENKAMMEPILKAFENNYRTFKHGAFHGFMAGLILSLSVLGINSLFERRSAKYILIHVGYWIISMCLMGGIISAWK
ncbi:MAG: hypothetical protein RL660_1776 [Bacteroidota bacterium]|jgi:hypothetical protein